MNAKAAKTTNTDNKAVLEFDDKRKAVFKIKTIIKKILYDRLIF
jgi:hypothetical protein